jgi:hypothetical protein
METPTPTIVERTIKSLKSSAPAQSLRARRRSRTVKDRHGDVEESYGSNYLLLENRRVPGPPKGFYYFGGCDLPSLYLMVPLLRDDVRGSLAMFQPVGGLPATRSDRQIQLLEEGARPDADELVERLHLPEHYFEPILVEPTFSIPVKGTDDFPKSVIAFSSASDTIRPLYRRKSTGTLVDPGGWWLNRSAEEALGDEDTFSWFKQEFTPVKRPTPERYTEAFGRLIREVKTRCHPEAILVFGTLTVEPSDPTHNYQFRPKAEVIRRRQFRFALQAMADREGFDLVDVDRVLKSAGIDEQLDFAHFPESSYPAVASEAYRILTSRGVV